MNKTVLAVLACATLLFSLCTAPSVSAQIVNGDFATGDLSGWIRGGFTDSGNGATNSLLSFGAAPLFSTFTAARSAGTSYADSTGVVQSQISSFDGFGPSLTNFPVTAPFGNKLAYVSNFSAQPPTGFNLLSGSYIEQSFIVPLDASLLRLEAFYLSNEGLDTAADQDGNVVGADFGGIALLDQNGSFLQQFSFDAQSGSAADSHVTNFSDDNSVGYGGFVSGTGWTSIAWDISPYSGQGLRFIAYSVNTGDTERESRLLLNGVSVAPASAPAPSVVPEPGPLFLLGFGFLLLFGLKCRNRFGPALFRLTLLLCCFGGSLGFAASAKAQTQTETPPFVVYAFEGQLIELGWLFQDVLGTQTISTPISPKPTFSERLDMVQKTPPGPYDGEHWAGDLSGWITMNGSVSEDIVRVKVRENFRYEHLGGWPFFISALKGGCVIKAYVLQEPDSSVQLRATRTINTAQGPFSPSTPVEHNFAARVGRESYLYKGRTYHRVGGEYWGGSGAVMPFGEAGHGDTGPTRPPYIVLGVGDVDYTFQVLPIRPVRLQPGNSGENHPTEKVMCLGIGPVLNLATANASTSFPDPVSTRGWPLSNNIVVNTQVVETERPMGNATFSYDVHLDWKTVTLRSGDVEEHLFVVDGDGARYDFGRIGAHKTPVGIICKLNGSPGGGYELSMAGPPANIKTPGYFKYLFDGGGNLLKITDDKGNDQVVNYRNGRITSVLDVNSGRKINFEWEGSRIARVIENNAAAVTQLLYSGGNLVRLEVGNAQTGIAYTSQLAYRPDGLLAFIQFDDDPQSRHSFDYQMFTDPQFPEIKIPYARITNAASTRLNVLYGDYPTSAPGLYAATTADGYIYNTNAFGDLTAILFPRIDADWNFQLPTYSFEYDANRNRTRVKTEHSEWRFVYGPRKQLLKKFDSAGGVWTNTYDELDLLTARDSVSQFLSVNYTGSSAHEPSSVQDGVGSLWTFGYNPFNQLTSVQSPLSHTTSYEFEEDPNHSHYSWLKTVTDGSGRSTSMDLYDGLGNLTQFSTGIGTYKTTYDAVHRPVLQVNPNGTNFRWTYQGQRLTKTTDENKVETDYNFCRSCGLLKSTSGPLGWSLRWAHDNNHKLTGFKDARGNTTTFNQSFGSWAGRVSRLEGIYYPDGTKRQFTYDRSLRLNSTTNGRGQAAAIAYDAASRIGRVAYSSNGPDVRYAYNLDGTVKSVTDANGITSYRYLANKLVSQVTYDYRASGLSQIQTVSYDYNADQKLTAIVWRSGGSIAGTCLYGYDGAGRILSVQGPGGLTTYRYDAEGKLLEQSNPNATSLSISYRPGTTFPARLEYQSGAAVSAGYDLTYDDGRDTVGNLTRVVDNTGVTTSYSYDLLYRLTGEQKGAFSRSYAYDLAGNLTQVNGATVASYDSANKLATVVGGRPLHDADGNITSISGTGLPNGRFFWDARDKMIRQSSGVVTIGYGYDASGRRVWSQAGTAAKKFYIFAGDLLLGEVGADGAVQAHYTWGANGLVSETLPRGTFWYQFGPQGETRQLTDAQGGVVENYAYTAYGVQTSPVRTNETPNPFRYGGKYGYYAEGPNGLMLCGQRWYSPQLTRWINRDPSGYEGGDNLYAYAAGNPTRFFDASGEHPVLIGAGVALLIEFFLSPTPIDEPYSEVDILVNYTEAACLGGISGKALKYYRIGKEWKIGSKPNDMRIAPFGNRTGNKYGSYPHYHHRGPGGIGRHRPWETKPGDSNFWNRF